MRARGSQRVSLRHMVMMHPQVRGRQQTTGRSSTVPAAESQPYDAGLSNEALRGQALLQDLHVRIYIIVRYS